VRERERADKGQKEISQVKAKYLRDWSRKRFVQFDGGTGDRRASDEIRPIVDSEDRGSARANETSREIERERRRNEKRD
jgi:hypothetical protein